MTQQRWEPCFTVTRRRFCDVVNASVENCGSIMLVISLWKRCKCAVKTTCNLVNGTINTSPILKRPLPFWYLFGVIIRVKVVFSQTNNWYPWAQTIYSTTAILLIYSQAKRNSHSKTKESEALHDQLEDSRQGKGKPLSEKDISKVINTISEQRLIWAYGILWNEMVNCKTVFYK